MTVKRTPHHDLALVQAKFATVDSLIIKTVALKNARSLGYDRANIVEAVQSLERGDFVKSETAHSPPNHRVWHDTYTLPWDGRWLYLKFAGETLIDIALTSFKERHDDRE